MIAMTVEKANELWAGVLAQEKLTTLLRLGYIPENLWSGNIRNIRNNETNRASFVDYVIYNAEFEWEIDHVCYVVKMTFPLFKLTKMTTKKDLFYEIQDAHFMFYLNGNFLNEFDLLKRVDYGNPTYSDELNTTIKQLVARMFVEVFNSSLRTYSDLNTK